MKAFSWPVAKKCPKAQSFTATSIGCFAHFLIRPAGSCEATSRMKAGGIRAKLTCLPQLGGE